jgi:predicted amidophosphoribosyltransferase
MSAATASKNRHRLARLFTGCDYSAPLKQMLHAFKHQRQSSLLPALSTLMLHHPPPWLPEAPIDAVLAMPLSAPRLAERGFNQSQLLARRIATAYGWPLLDKRRGFAATSPAAIHAEPRQTPPKCARRVSRGR